MKRWGFSGPPQNRWHILKPDDATQAHYDTFCGETLDKTGADVRTLESRPDRPAKQICWKCERVEREERRANQAEPPRQETLFQDEQTISNRPHEYAAR